MPFCLVNGNEFNSRLNSISISVFAITNYTGITGIIPESILYFCHGLHAYFRANFNLFKRKNDIAEHHLIEIKCFDCLSSIYKLLVIQKLYSFHTITLIHYNYIDSNGLSRVVYKESTLTTPYSALWSVQTLQPSE